MRAFILILDRSFLLYWLPRLVTTPSRRFSCYIVLFHLFIGWGKVSWLTNCYHLCSTHPPWFFSPYFMINMFFHHSCFRKFMISLTHLESALVTYGGLSYFSKPSLWASMSCLLSNFILSINGVLFMYTMLINNTWKYAWIIIHFSCI